ncbi:MAG: aminotransferase class IV [Candidatus Kerfeldbacteria bacterium]|nr:aminotransferase class IV [Candidatus Kerfeldbacteria bacterium]
MSVALQHLPTREQIARMLASDIEHAFRRGAWTNIEAGNLCIKEAAVHYGAGLFEGIRYFLQAGGIFLLDEHLERAVVGAETLRLEIPDGYEHIGWRGFMFGDFREAILITVALNPGMNSYVRPWFGRGLRRTPPPPHTIGSGLHVRSWDPDPKKRCWTDYAVVTEHWPGYIAVADGSTAIAMIYHQFERPLNRFFPTWMKGIAGYVTGTMASDEAAMVGANEAMMGRFGSDGQWRNLDGPGQAIAIVEDGAFITPDPAQSEILPSTQCAWFMQTVAPRIGLAVKYGDLPTDRIAGASELLYIGSATGIKAFGELWDGDPAQGGTRYVIGTGRPGPVYQELHAHYELAREGQAYAESITGVPPRGQAIKLAVERTLTALKRDPSLSCSFDRH